MKLNFKSLLLISCVSLLFHFTQAQQGKRMHPELSKTVHFDSNVDDPLTQTELKMLKEVFGDQLEPLVLNKPQRLKDIKNLLRNRIKFIEYPEGNQKPYPLLSEVPLFDNYVPNLKRDLTVNEETFNPLKYNFPFFEKNTITYRIDNTNKFIIILSQFN